MLHQLQQHGKRMHTFVGKSECEGKYSHRIWQLYPTTWSPYPGLCICLPSCYAACVWCSFCLHCICWWRLQHNNDLMSRRRAEPEWINVYASQWRSEWKRVKVRENEEKLTTRSFCSFLGMRRINWEKRNRWNRVLVSISSCTTRELIEFCRRGKEGAERCKERDGSHVLMNIRVRREGKGWSDRILTASHSMACCCLRNRRTLFSASHLLTPHYENASLASQNVFHPKLSLLSLCLCPHSREGLCVTYSLRLQFQWKGGWEKA